MPIVTIQPSGKTIEAAEGSTVLAAVLAAGDPILQKCDARGECGACHISLLEGRKSVSRIGAAENAKLDTMIGIGSKSRLACQVRLGSENVTIELINFA